MRLSPARVEQTLNQFEAHVIPDSHPSMPAIKNLWGDHTYFLAVNGLNIVEPLDRRDSGPEVGTSARAAGDRDRGGIRSRRRTGREAGLDALTSTVKTAPAPAG